MVNNISMQTTSVEDEPFCLICFWLRDPETGLCTNPDCPNSLPDPQLATGQA